MEVAMAIAVDQATAEITHRVDGMKIGEVSSDSMVRTLPDIITSPDVITDEYTGAEGTVDLHPSEFVYVEQESTYPSMDPTALNPGMELSQPPICVSPNVLTCPQGPMYTGYPVPVVNDHGYAPHPMGGLVYQNPVGQFAPLYDGNLHPAHAMLYPQALYPQYPVSLAGHYAVAAPSTPETCTMITGLPSQGPFMPHAVTYPYASHFMPTAAVELPSGFYSVPDIMPNPWAPIWAQQPVYSKGSTHEGNVVLPQLSHQPTVLENVAYTDKSMNAMRQTPSTAMPFNHYDARSQWQWQYFNAGEPWKAPTLKNRRPEKVDLTSESTHILPEFSINFNDAKHFIIKSFSEENVRRSIQHGVWASTSNGNKKLDEGYQDAQRRAKGKARGCPVFLYFSVNGSGRFCGVAEMVGPVDYNNTKDFWERSRWCGSFPVKWCIINDVPNSQLRGILLKENENKPVTSSRDTQEVNFEDGMQMLKIIKSYPAKASILHNHSSYFKAMPEGKCWQVSPLVQSNEQPKNVVEQPNKSFEELAKVPEHLEERPALEESNALKTCNGEAKGKENHIQKRPIQTKDESIMEDDGGGKKQQIDKENVMTPGVSMLV